MRGTIFLVGAALAVALAGCGDDDVRPSTDAGVDGSSVVTDGGGDGGILTDGGGMTDGGVSDGGVTGTSIEDVLASSPGPVNVPLDDVLVTYLRPGIGGDMAGFFVQSEMTGPALFVQTDLTDVMVGDQISLRITVVDLLVGHVRAVAYEDLVVLSASNDVSALVQDVSSAADLATALTSYRNELISTDVTIVGTPEIGGTGFMRASADTPAITGDARIQLRLPTPLFESYPLAVGCSLHVEGTPLWPFNDVAQISAWEATEISAVSCP